MWPFPLHQILKSKSAFFIERLKSHIRTLRLNNSLPPATAYTCASSCHLQLAPLITKHNPANVPSRLLPCIPEIGPVCMVACIPTLFRRELISCLIQCFQTTGKCIFHHIPSMVRIPFPDHMTIGAASPVHANLIIAHNGLYTMQYIDLLIFNPIQ